MASSCATIPTLTTTQVQTTDSTQTIVTSTVSVIQPTTTVLASTTTICPTFTRGTATPSCNTSTVFMTTIIPGTTTTMEVTQTTVVPVTTTVMGTLFSTSCVAITSPGDVTPQPPSSSSSSSSSSTTSTTSVVTSLSTSTSNGTTIVQTFTVTPTVSASPSDVAGGSSSTPNPGPIIGGAIGGFFGLIALVLGVWWLMKRRTNWDDIFEKEALDQDHISPMPRRDPPSDPRPKPYEYGLVGHHVPPPMSPPSTTGMSLSSDSQPYAQHPDPFAAQQHLGQGGQGYGAEQLSQQQNVGASGGGSQGYGPGAEQLTQQQNVGTGGGTQGFGPGAEQLSHQQPLGAGQGSQGYGPSSADPFSQQPIGTPNVGGAPHTPSNIPGIPAVPIIPIPMPVPNNSSRWAAPGAGRNPSASGSGARQTRPGPPSTAEESDVFGLLDTESSVGAGPSGSISSHGRTHPSFSASTVASHAPLRPTTGSSTYEFDPYMEVQQPLQPQRERRDGKGRLITTGEKRPIVHLDGGRYMQPGTSAAATGSDPVAAPPAYTA